MDEQNQDNQQPPPPEPPVQQANTPVPQPAAAPVPQEAPQQVVEPAQNIPPQQVVDASQAVQPQPVADQAVPQPAAPAEPEPQPVPSAHEVLQQRQQEKTTEPQSNDELIKAGAEAEASKPNHPSIKPTPGNRQPHGVRLVGTVGDNVEWFRKYWTFGAVVLVAPFGFVFALIILVSGGVLKRSPADNLYYEATSSEKIVIVAAAVVLQLIASAAFLLYV